MRNHASSTGGGTLNEKAHNHVIILTLLMHWPHGHKTITILRLLTSLKYNYDIVYDESVKYDYISVKQYLKQLY